MTRSEGEKAMRYWEDFTVGMVMEFGGYEVTEEEVIEFATEFDPQSFHIDKEAAKEHFFGGLIASGWHTGCLLYTSDAADE